MGENLTDNKNIIAIDGPSGVGKGTLAAQIGDYYGFAVLDTGALYRAVTLHLMRSGIDMAALDEKTAAREARKISLDHSILRYAKDPEIRGPVISKLTSEIAPLQKMRAELRKYQRDFGLRPPALPDGSPALGAVIEGRDITTVIFPDAPVRIFLTASANVKAARRYKQYVESGIPADYKQILAEQIKRDERDATRDAGRLQIAKGVIVIDNSKIGKEECFHIVRGIIKEKLGLV